MGFISTTVSFILINIGVCRVVWFVETGQCPVSTCRPDLTLTIIFIPILRCATTIAYIFYLVGFIFTNASRSATSVSIIFTSTLRFLTSTGFIFYSVGFIFIKTSRSATPVCFIFTSTLGFPTLMGFIFAREVSFFPRYRVRRPRFRSFLSFFLNLYPFHES